MAQAVVPGGLVVLRDHDHTQAEQTLGPDDVVEVRLPGGGGYGPAGARDRHLCVLDLVEGYVL